MTYKLKRNVEKPIYDISVEPGVGKAVAVILERIDNRSDRVGINLTHNEIDQLVTALLYYAKKLGLGETE